jgi:hypothetical protein
MGENTPEYAGHGLARAGQTSEDVAPDDDRPAIGSWWWLTSRSKDRDDSRYDRPGRQWLGCIVEVGSNYAKVEHDVEAWGMVDHADPDYAYRRCLRTNNR